MFEPFYPNHAVETCVITLFFDQPLPAKPFSRLRARAEERFARQNYVRQETPSFQIDALSGRMQPLPSSQVPVQFMSVNNGASLLLTNTHIVWQTSQYVRWKQFSDAFSRILEENLDGLFNTASIAGLKLEYVDRFLWTGKRDEIDANQLLKRDTDLVPSVLRDKARNWHGHVGWFDNQDQPFRRLVNVNVDVVDGMRPGMPAPVPAIGVYTSMHDQPNPWIAHGGELVIPEDDLGARLDDLHVQLKNLLGALINENMQTRIRLQGAP